MADDNRAWLGDARQVDCLVPAQQLETIRDESCYLIVVDRQLPRTRDRYQEIADLRLELSRGRGHGLGCSRARCRASGTALARHVEVDPGGWSRRFRDEGRGLR